MRKLTVNLPGREYDILIERGVLDGAGGYLKEKFKGGKLAVVTDSNVGPLYGGRVEVSLAAVGFETRLITVPAGEASKSVPTLERIYDGLMEFGLTRTDGVVALGGGVVGDLAGFAAATILRGVGFVQIPTTLLAQVDSSVGGKVAVNLKAGKNLAGAFYQPRLVLIDPDCLGTLPDRNFSDGMAEVIKYGAIADRELFDRLLGCGDADDLMDGIEDIIWRCCDIKRGIVERDETDLGPRMLLNFGHTLGHAYELAGGFEKYTHGEAVAAGMCAMAGLGERWGLTKKGAADLLREAVSKYRLPESITVEPEQYAAALGLDKKGAGDSLTVILLSDIGSAFPYKMTKSDLRKEVGA